MDIPVIFGRKYLSTELARVAVESFLVGVPFTLSVVCIRADETFDLSEIKAEGIRRSGW